MAQAYPRGLGFAADEVEERVYVFFGGEAGNVDLIAQGVGQSVGHALAHAEALGRRVGAEGSLRVTGRDFLVGMYVTM